MRLTPWTQMKTSSELLEKLFADNRCSEEWGDLSATMMSLPVPIRNTQRS